MTFSGTNDGDSSDLQCSFGVADGDCMSRAERASRVIESIARELEVRGISVLQIAEFYLVRQHLRDFRRERDFSPTLIPTHLM